MSDLYSLLALHRCLWPYPRAVHDLIRQFESAENVLRFARASDLLAAGIRRADALAIPESLGLRIERDVQWLTKEKHHLITIDDDDYPSLLKQIYDPPVLLYGRGNRDGLRTALVPLAIVGARKASRYGLGLAEKIATELSDGGVTVVSGLALGIDGAAHLGALSGRTPTIGVLGCGCDLVYPARHRGLAEHVMGHGMLLSEFPPGTPALPHHFPRRNRLVTGMSLATLVIEAATRSGSLISARLALAEGRDVMAVPGQVTNRLAAGCNALIRDGARLIQHAQDVFEELGITVMPTAPSANQIPVTPLQQVILDALERQPLGIDDLAVEHQVQVPAVLGALTELEVMGLVSAEMGVYSKT